MNVASWLGSLGSEVVWQIVLTGFALIAALLGGVAALQGRTRVPALAAALVVAVLGEIVAWSWPPADPAELKPRATTFAAVHLIAPLTVGPVALVTGAMAAVVGAREAPRRRWTAAAGVAVALVAAAVVAWGGYASANPLYAGIRAVAYVGAGALIGAALLAGGERGWVGASVGAAVLPLIVAAGEASERGLVTLILVGQTEIAPADAWRSGVDQMLALVQTEWVAGRVAVGIACLAGAVGVAAAREARAQAALLAVLAALAAGALVAESDLGAERAYALEAVPRP